MAATVRGMGRTLGSIGGMPPAAATAPQAEGAISRR